MTNYIPAILIFIAVGILVVGLIMYFARSKTPKSYPITTLSDLHVCVSQLKSQLQALPTNSHKDFCKALKKGITSSCKDLKILMTDENGNNTVSFTYKNGAYFPSSNLNCNIEGTDILMFRTLEVGHEDVDGITQIILN
jgi:hypothetical protein